jgi:hypothetical protein
MDQGNAWQRWLISVPNLLNWLVMNGLVMRTERLWALCKTSSNEAATFQAKRYVLTIKSCPIAGNVLLLRESDY